jgi:hypothetical protein
MYIMANSSYIKNRKLILHSTAIPLCPNDLYAAKSYHGQADKTDFQVLVTKKSKLLHYELDFFSFF